jgi:hypothetical protein
MRIDANSGYIFRAQFIPVSGQLAGATFVLPVGHARQAAVIVQPGNFVLTRIFGNGPNNEICVKHPLQAGETHVVEVHVSPGERDATIRIVLDGTEVISWTGALTQLNEATGDIFLEAFRATTIFEVLEYREIPM